MKSKLAHGALAVLVGAACACSNARTSAIELDRVQSSLRQEGPKATLRQYFSCERYEGTAYERIAGGSPEWVALAERMLQHSDACYAAGILSSLGSAMQSQPRNVLPLVGKTPQLAADHICLPFISDEQPPKVQLAEVRKSKEVIEGVRDEKLSSQKAACLRFIAPVETGLAAKAASEQSDPAREPARGQSAR